MMELDTVFTFRRNRTTGLHPKRQRQFLQSKAIWFPDGRM